MSPLGAAAHTASKARCETRCCGENEEERKGEEGGGRGRGENTAGPQQAWQTAPTCGLKVLYVTLLIADGSHAVKPEVGCAHGLGGSL